ncbi:VOC family protein [Nonomuraea sp. NPDC052116]|uniref:VOC family protein n=1 Tax=Nonomuraea sp. NPDC052116 TaxID=3155665 RepID=UPI00341F5372
MATHRTLGCDAADPHRIAAFWAQALGYVAEPGYDDPDGASIIDPDGKGPANGEHLGHAVMLDPDLHRVTSRPEMCVFQAGAR